MILKGKTRIIIAGTLLIAVLVFSFVLLEFFESRKELLKSLGSQAVILTKSLSLSFENSILTNNEVESLLTSKLDAVASIVINLHESRMDIKKPLGELLGRYDVDYIAVADRSGRVLSQMTNNNSAASRIPPGLAGELQPLYSREYEWLDLGTTDFPLTDRPMYIYARADNEADNSIIIGINSDRIAEFRRRIGIGKQIRAIAGNPDIVYLVLQDEHGIVSASREIKELSSIESDKFLSSAFNSNNPSTRLIDYKGTRIFESVQAITLPDGSKVLNRLGLSTANIRAIQQRSMRRVILIGAGIFVLFSVLYAYIITKKGFAELKKEHSRIKSYNDLVLDNMADAVIATDAGFRIIYFNNAASLVFGISPGDAIGKHYEELFPDDFLLIRQSYERKETVVNLEIEYTGSHTAKKILELSTSFVYEDSGEIDIIIAQLKDHTEKKAIQTQLEIKEKLSAMGALASGVAHEIRNPLNSINILAQRVQREFHPSEKQEDFQKFMQTIRSEVTRVNHIIRQFLDFARPPRLNKSDLLICEVIDDCISVVETEARLKDVVFTREFNCDCALSADREKMKQVFINLFRNSLDAMDSGHIKCSVHKNNSMAEIQVSDTGSGIPKDILPRVFNLYFTTKSNGNGLGLSIVHQIVSEHNGSIEVDSIENSGTTVIIKLPLNEQHSVPKN